MLMTNEMHNSYNQFYFTVFLSALHVSNESSHSSSGARHTILCYTVWYNRAGESSCFEVVEYHTLLFIMWFVHFQVSGQSS